MQRATVEDFDMLLHQQRIAMPANAVRTYGHRNMFVDAMAVDQREGQRTHALAETAIRLLQGDDVGIEFSQNVKNALRLAASVDADSLANIIAGDSEGLFRQSKDHFGRTMVCCNGSATRSGSLAHLQPVPDLDQRVGELPHHLFAMRGTGGEAQ